MTVAHTALIGEPMPGVAARQEQEQRWHAWQTRNAERERVYRRRLADAFLLAVAAAAVMSAFWVAFGATS